MQNSYVLGKDKKIFDFSMFPQIDVGEQIGILYTGGIKSHLLALIAKELYGIENIIFVLETDTGNNSKDLNSLKNNFNNGISILNGIHVFQTGDNNYDNNELFYGSFVDSILARYPNIKYLLSGYDIFIEQTMQLLENSGWSKGLKTREELIKYLKQNQNNFPVVHRNHTESNVGIPMIHRKDVYLESYIFLNNIARPFKNLDLYEIIEMYDENNLLPQLSQTISCKKSVGNTHCGKCKNCLQRKNAFSLARVPDLTKYSLN